MCLAASDTNYVPVLCSWMGCEPVPTLSLSHSQSSQSQFNIHWKSSLLSASLRAIDMSSPNTCSNFYALHKKAGLVCEIKFINVKMLGQRQKGQYHAVRWLCCQIFQDHWESYIIIMYIVCVHTLCSHTHFICMM